MNLIKQMFHMFMKGAITFLLLLVIVSVVIIVLEIRVELSFLNKPVEVAIEKVLDRDFSMKGDVVLIPTLWPSLEIHDVSIGNPEEKKWESAKELAHFGRLHLQMGLIPLLFGEIYIVEVSAEDITLNLESDVNGNPNWIFELSDNSSTVLFTGEKLSHEQQTNQTDSEQFFHFEALDEIVLKNINVRYFDQALKKSIYFNMEQFDGEASAYKDIDIKFHGKFQDKEYAVKLKGGRLKALRDKSQEWPLVLDMIVAGTNIELSGSLKRGKEPELIANMVVGKSDIGATLSWFKILDGLNITSQRLIVNAKVQGDSLSELIRSAELSVVLKKVLWNLSDKNTGEQLPIKIAEGTIKIEPKKPVQVELNGLLDKSKINIHVTGAPIIDYTLEKRQTPLALVIKAYKTDLSLETKISPSTNVQNLSFKMILKGNSLSDLNQLIQIDLPPLGPYYLEGFFKTNQKGYQIKNLLLAIKDSQLKGNMLLNMQTETPFFEIDLKSEQIQINNFDVGEWSATTEDIKNNNENNKTKTSTVKTQAKIANREAVSKLLNHKTLSRFDINSKIAVNQVLSGKDKLGSGFASLMLENARLNINLSELKLPGGNASAHLIYHPSGKNSLDIALQLKVENFDYGIMARRIDTKSEVGGMVNLDIDLSSKNAKNMNSLLANSQGYLDFSWQPKALDADLFEMWAINIMSALLKNADKDISSKVNCVIGRFIFDQGKMREKVIFADTTKMRMAGTAEANFKSRTIKVKVAPRAKKAEFFSLATPIGVEGSFDNFNIAINPLGITKTVVSFVTSPLHVPVRRLFRKGLPEDGLDACKAMWEVSEEKLN